MRAFAAVFVVALFIAGVIPTVSPPSMAENTFLVDTFGNGQPSATIGFPTAGMDDSASLSLQTGLTINNASMSVSSVRAPPGSTDYPSNVSIDFGGDGVQEWQFMAKDIGSLGRQTTFNNGATKAEMLFRNTNYNNTLGFRLPKRATVTSAKMDLSVAAKGRILVIYADLDLPSVDNVVSNIKKFTS
jgi:hypothetical protein